MPGTYESGKKAAKTNRKRQGEDWYGRIGAIGGANGHTGGFHQNRELASIAGKIGGSISRRGEKKLSKHRVQSIKREFSDQMRQFREQSDMQVSSLSAKYGVKRSWK